MFTDHDFMSDAWEDKYPSSVTSRGVWDALKDPDDDGWSNWAEYQAGTRPDMEAYLGVDNSTQEEYPVPVIEASVVYNGKRTNAKSVMAVMLAGINCGAKPTIEVSGENEQQVLDELCELFEKRFE